ncbi:MAG: DUF3108 domain-containing protein [bacterium]
MKIQMLDRGTVGVGSKPTLFLGTKAQIDKGINLRALRLHDKWLFILMTIIIIGSCSYGFAEKLSFNGQEILSFSVEMFGMKIGAQTMQSCLLPGSQTLRLISETKTTPFASKIYKLHNQIETHISMKDSLPIYIKNQIQEGKYVRHWTAELDQRNHLGTVTLISGTGNKKIGQGQGGSTPDTLSLQPNTINIPALIYYLRMTELRLNNSFSFALLKENDVEKIMVRVAKQERVHVPYGDFSALKVVSSSGDVNIWFTNDKKQLPIRIECQTNAGWLKADLVGVK